MSAAPLLCLLASNAFNVHAVAGHQAVHVM